MKKIRVCMSRSCAAFGAGRIMEKISEQTGLQPGEKNDTIDLDFCGCLGYCSRSPNVNLNDTNYIFSTSVDTVMEDIEKGGEDMTGKELEIDIEDNFLQDI